MSSSKIDLTLFCAASGDPRFYLTRPFSIGDYTLASNGHILIRIARQDDIMPPENMPEKAAMTCVDLPSRINKKLGTETGALRLAEFDPELVDCDTCAGAGKINICPQCGGYGETGGACELDNETCTTCDGLGCVPIALMPLLLEKFPQAIPPGEPEHCPTCCGLGKRCTDYKYRLGATTLGTQYLLLTKTLPNATIYAFGPPQDPALSRFDAGLGVLMPRRD
jgi:hypothetical protein